MSQVHALSDDQVGTSKLRPHARLPACPPAASYYVNPS